MTRCHHPQGGFCDRCRAPGLTDREQAEKLVRDSDQRIHEFAAYFVEGSEELCGLVNGIQSKLIAYVEADIRRRRREKSGALDYVSE